MLAARIAMANTKLLNRPVQSSGSPVGHVQKEGASGGVKLKAEQPLELRDEDVFVGCAHAAKFLREFLVYVQVHSLHRHLAS